MLSKYFEMKTVREDFKSHMKDLFKELEGKKVVIYGAGEGFEELNKRYNFKERFEVVAIADKKFETCECDVFGGFRAIQPADIVNKDFDYILITNEINERIIDYLLITLNIDSVKIKVVFNTEIPDETINIDYLESFNFSKSLLKLKKKLKNKTVIIYGSGAFFQVIKKFYDISDMNIIGIADRRFENHSSDETFLGYKVYAPSEIKEANPDYVLVATKYYIEIIEELFYETLAKTKIKIKPLLKKNLRTLIKELWS
jgi:FlaA1/EpsC-like NDP-sugar epimerase